ncbi:hypothetical protein [Amycolatopsis sp. NPDC021455]|uniref:hypothetical protein n=1 Tax=Amycolatopsis sp. NPDC021455 TaxID=3154901 RepID=UPI0033CF811C
MKHPMRRMAALAAAVVAAASMAGCSHGPADRRALCTQFDKLGNETMTAYGLLANAVFASAGDLADLARRYQGGGLTADADALERISGSRETNGLELEKATSGTAAVCGHPLGIGTTSYTGTGGGSGVTPPGGGYGSYGGYAAPGTTSSPELPTSSSSSARSDDDSAQAMLRRQADADRARVDALADRWVPQLSSKNYGLVADGTTYGYGAIWADFTTTKQSFPAALLLWSGDYTSFARGDFWVTVENTPFATASAADGWCAAARLDADHCFAKLVSHTHSPQGSTSHR